PDAGDRPTDVRGLLARALGRWRAFFAGSAASCFLDEIHIIPLGNEPDLAQYADGVIEYGLPYGVALHFSGSPPSFSCFHSTSIAESAEGRVTPPATRRASG